MKKKSVIQDLSKKVGSLFLVVCMLLSTLPMHHAFAAGEDNTPAGNAFEALGIDNKKTPEGYKQNARNPYGKDVLSTNPVQELYIAGLGNAVQGNNVVSFNETTETSETLQNLGSKFKEDLLGTLRIRQKVWSLPGTYSYTLYGDGVYKTPKKALEASSSREASQGNPTMYNQYLAFAEGVDNSNAYLKDVYRGLTNKQIAISAMAAGTFDNSRIDTNAENQKDAFRKSQVAIVYTSDLDKNGGLYLKIRDVRTGEESDPIELMSTGEIIGNPDLLNDRGTWYENFQLAPYLLQNYLKVTTGDYDADGIDEIAVYVPKKGDSKIVVYKLGKASGDGGEAFLTANKWQRDWTYSLQETSYTSNMVSLTSGDFNRDGIDDLAGTWGYYYGPQENKGSKAVVMFGDTNHRLQDSRQFDLNYQGSNLVRGAFIYGDFFSKGNNMLIFGGQSDADLKAGNTYTRYVCAYVWNGNNFVAKTQKNFNLFEKDGEGKLLYPTMKLSSTPSGVTKPEEDPKATFLSLPLAPVNMAVAAQGLPNPANDKQSPSKLYLDSLLIGGVEDGFQIEKRLDRPAYNQGEEFVEYQAVSGDMNGDGISELAVLRQKLVQTDTVTVTREINTGQRQEPIYEKKSYYKNWAHKLIKNKSYRWVITGYKTVAETGQQKESINYITKMPEVDVQVLNSIGTLLKELANQDISTTLCMTNTDSDTTFMKYTGKHGLIYSDPKVLAVLASPPFFQDLLRDDLSGSYGESETSYSSTKGSGSSDTTSFSVRAGGYFGFEHETQVLGIPVASFEFETEIGLESTEESEKMQMQEQTISYSTIAGSDTVVLYSMPIEVYEYEVYRPDNQGTYKSTTITRNIPHPAAVRTMELDRYQDIQKDFASVLPDISEQVLRHEIGKPETYPNQVPIAGGSVNKVIAYKGDPIGVGFSASGASITQEIAMSQEENEHFEIVQNFDFKIGGGLGGFKAGVTIGKSEGKGVAFITTSGSSFSGTLFAMPIEAEHFGYGYLWKIFSYQYNEGEMSFPVVNYVVTDVKQPAPLPTDFEQNVAETTDKTAVLTWSYDKEVAGFQLYSYNQYPDGAGLDELAYVPFDEGERQQDGKHHFKYVVENLNPYTEYQFKIQTVQSALPPKSIPSEALSVRTKTQKGYPTIKIKNKTENKEITDGKVRLYPDANLTVQVAVENPENYRGINYQWQKKDGSGQWKELPGKTDAAYLFKTANYGDRGSYRCRVNLRYFDESAQKEFYISAYSDELIADYSKRPVTFGSAGLNAGAIPSGVTATAALISASNNHYTAPTGKVQFRLSGVNVSQEKTVSLTKENTPEDGKNVAKGQASFTNLEEGVYEVTVSYLGDSIFAAKDFEEKKLVVVGNATGKIAALKSGDQKKDRFTYGDPIKAEVYDVTTNAETLSTETYTYTLYQYKNYQKWQAKQTDLSSGEYLRTKVAGGKTWQFKTTEDSEQQIGYYRLDVTNQDESWKNQLFFEIDPKNIHIKAKDITATTGSVADSPATYEISQGALVEGETLPDDFIQYTFYNSAGNKVNSFGNNVDPGNYRIEPSLKDSNQETNPYLKKYKFTFENGVYKVLGGAYELRLEAEKVGHLFGGTVKMDEYNQVPQEVIAGTSMHFTATPYSGYQVAEWAVYENDNTSQTVNSQTGGNTFTHTMKSAKTKVVVRFKKVDYTIAVFSPRGGTIQNDEGIEFSESGTAVTKGATFRFTAVPQAGYSFKQWNISPNTTDVITKMDGNEAEITVARPNIQIRAEFARDQYTLNLGEQIGAYYMFDHDNDSSTDKVKKELRTGDKISKDEDVFCYLMPGYALAEGAKWKIDNVEQDNNNIENEELKIAKDSVEGNAITVTAATVAKQLKLTTKVAESGSADNNDALGKVSVKIDDTPVTDPEQLKNVAGSNKVVFEAKAAHGYRFVKWVVDGTEITNSTSTYTIERLAKDTDVVAVMASEETKTVTVTVEPSHKAEPKYTLIDRYGEQVGEEQALPIGQAITVYKGDSLKVNLNLKPYITVDQWQVGGVPVEIGPNASYTFTDIKDNIVAAAYLTAAVEHQITIKTEGATGGEKLKVTLGDQTLYEGAGSQTQKVQGGETLRFTATGLDQNRCITQWTVNGEQVVPSEDGSLEFFVNKGATIVATFGDLVEYDWSLPQDYQQKADIQVDALPASTNLNKVRKGAKLTFTITPKDGYVIRQEDIALGEGKTFTSVTKADGKWIAVIDSVNGDVNLQLEAKKRTVIKMKEGDTTAGLSEDSDTLSYTGGKVQFSVTDKTLADVVEGDTVTLTVTPESRYLLESIKAYTEDDPETDLLTSDDSGYTFTAPAKDIIVEAKFKYHYVAPSPSPYPYPSPSPSPTPSPAPTPNPGEQPKEEKIELPKAITESVIIPEKTTSIPNKEWTIKLTLELSELNDKEVFLLDEDGNSLEAEIGISTEASDRFVVRPKKAYVNGKKYYIYIRKDGLVSKNGKKLKKDVIFSFVYQN